jgi:hypothetical protein
VWLIHEKVSFVNTCNSDALWFLWEAPGSGSSHLYVGVGTGCEASRTAGLGQ